ncbi:helix-turn-helix domain-containing protein [Muriicola sp.]|uniref:helix-turn-helix domain-containing protein n=1 Tax=Muriicola sp. TaxID=2020856 RepID=UPI003C76E218
MDKQFKKVFSDFIFCTNVEEAFSAKKSVKINFYTLMWVTDGMVDLLVDNEVVGFNKQQMIFLTPIHHVKLLENHSQVNIVMFNRDFYCIKENDHEVSCNGILFFGSQGVPIINLDNKQTEGFNRLLGVLKEEFEIADTIQEEMLRALLKRWLINATRIMKSQSNYVGENKTKLELVRKFRILLEMHYKDYHKVSDYAKLLHKSPKTLSNRFSSLGLPSPREMILDRIFVEAKRYLLYTQFSIKEIASKLGFEDTSAFSHFFKNRSQSSPTNFRAEHYQN